MLSRLLARAWVRDLFLGAALLCAAAGLMFFPTQCMAAARDGLLLCYNVIIPSLFPFFVLSSLVVELGLAGYVGRALEPVMRPLFGVPGVCASAFALGFIGGYPVGAKTAIHLYQAGMCTKTEAERLLAFCNNSGPAFILGVVGAGVFSSSKIGLLLYLAHAAASVLIGLLFRFYKAGSGGRETKTAPQFQVRRASVAFTTSVRDSFLGILNICAFVVFFTVVIRMLFLTGILPGIAAGLGALLSPLGLSSVMAEHLLTGLLEISSGVWSLSGTGALAGRLSLAAFMLGWAGLSIHCQVLSFVGDSGLSVRTYLTGKLLHASLSALLIGLLTRVVPLSEPVGAYLNDQVDSIAGLDFSAALTTSIVAAFLVLLFYFAVACYSQRRQRGASCRIGEKTAGNRKKNMLY